MLQWAVDSSTAVIREWDEATAQHFPEFLQPACVPSLKAIALERKVGAGLLAAVKGGIGLVASPKPVEIGAPFERSGGLGRARRARGYSEGEQDCAYLCQPRTKHTGPNTAFTRPSSYRLGCTRLHSSLNATLSNMAVALTTLPSRISKNHA